MNSFDAEFPEDQAIVRAVEARGAKRERERIIELIKGAPISFEWFQPFVATTTLIKQIEEGVKQVNYTDDPTYIGDYDDICAQCGAEQSIAVYEGVYYWNCGRCEYENEVNEVE